MTYKKEFSKGKMIAVIGAQYGSEGKGAIVSHIANNYGMHVRVGSPNAGHTIYWNGDKHVMQSIPCGWINPDAAIVIGRGALINVKLLLEEIKHIERYYPNFKDRLFIDEDAGILDERFYEEEGGTHGEMHERIGSTGEGVGPARMARLSRNPRNFRLFKDIAYEIGLTKVMHKGTPLLIANCQDSGYNVLLEGTQGSALSLLHSNWPYCTSIDTNSAAILSECGIAPDRLTKTLLVARTYPIRVHGNSGPMMNETTWDALSSKLGKHVIERTTVTKKVRRVAEWDDALIRNAVLLNGNVSMALMFADYVDPNVYGTTDKSGILDSAALASFIKKHGIRKMLKYVGTSPSTVVNM